MGTGWLVKAHHTGEPGRDGRIIEVHGANGERPYFVECSDYAHVGFVPPVRMLRLSISRTIPRPSGPLTGTAKTAPIRDDIVEPAARPIVRLGPHDWFISAAAAVLAPAALIGGSAFGTIHGTAVRLA